MKKINVLIVDDSAFMRKLITEFLSEDNRIQVIGTARNGEDAIAKVEKLKPDVVTLDVEMPVMNGLDALKHLMEHTPVPVVMLSSTTKEGTENTSTAMLNGAFDFIAKPSGAISLDLHKVKSDIIEKVIEASKTNILKLQKNIKSSGNAIATPNIYSKMELGGETKQEVKQESKTPKWDTASRKLVLIGASTGGPRALQTVLTELPSSIDAPILIVQHMPPGFTKSLADRLNTLCEINVKEAEDSELIQKGTAYIAPGGYHMKVKKVGLSLAIVLDKTELRNGHRPSVDVMFESASHLKDFSKVAVIMTGMGSDGADGLSKLKNMGQVKAIAESQETSIVFGMPKAAIATNYVDRVEDIEKIAAAIMSYCKY